MISREVRHRARQADPGDIDGWWDDVSGDFEDLVGTGFDLAAQLGGAYVTEYAALDDINIESILADSDAEQIATSLRVTGPVAFKRAMGTYDSEDAALRIMGEMLDGSSTRLTLGGDRDTVLGTINGSDSIRGWQRVTSGNPCKFCEMLAGRGAVYKSEESAGGNDAWHDHCACSVEPVTAAE